MATLSSLLSLHAPGDAAPAAATASAVQSARPTIGSLPGPVVCVVAQGWTDDPYHPMLVDPCGAPGGATPMQRAVWLQRQVRSAGAPAGQCVAHAPAHSAAVSTALASSAGGGCEANRGHPGAAAGMGMPSMPSSTHQQEQQEQQQQQVIVLPFTGDPRASRVGIMADTVGVFHPELYVRGEPCVKVVGSPPAAGATTAAFATCSQFEKLGGGRMARWYKSIYVVQPLQRMEDWLKCNRLAVRVGKSRTPRKGRAQAEEPQQEQEREQQPKEHGRKRRSGGARTGRQHAADSLSGEQEMQSDEDTSDSGSDDWAQGRLVGGRSGQYSGRKRTARGRAGNGGKRQARVAQDCAIVVRESSDVAGGVEAADSRQPSLTAPEAGVASGGGQGRGLLVQSFMGAPHLVTPLTQQPQLLPLPVPQLQQPPLLSQLRALPPQHECALPLHDEAVPHWDSQVHQAGSARQPAPATGPTGGPPPSTYQQLLQQAIPQLQPYEQCADPEHSPHQQQEHQQSVGPWFVGSCTRGPDSAVPPTAGVFTPFLGAAPRQQLPQPQLLQQHRSVFPSSLLQEQSLGCPYTAGPGNPKGLGRAPDWPAAAPVLMGPPQAWSGPSPQRSGFNQRPSQLWQQYYNHQPQWQEPQQQLMLQEQQPYDSRPLRSVSSSLSSSWYVEGCAGPSSSAHGAMPYDDDTPTSAAMPAGPGMTFRKPGAAAYNVPYGASYPETAGAHALPQRPRATTGPQKPQPVYVLVDMPASGGSGWAPALPPFPPATAKAWHIPPAPNGAAPPPRFWQGDAGQGNAHHPVPYARNGAMEPQQQQQQQGGPRWAVTTDWGEDGHAHGHSTCSQYAAPGPYPQGQEAWAGHDRPRLYPGEQQQQWPQPPPLQPLLQPLQPLPPPLQQQQQQHLLAVRAPPPPQAPPAAAATAGEAAGVVLAGEGDGDDWPELHDLFTMVDNDVGITSEMAGGM